MAPATSGSRPGTRTAQPADRASLMSRTRTAGAESGIRNEAGGRPGKALDPDAMMCIVLRPTASKKALWPCSSS